MILEILIGIYLTSIICLLVYLIGFIGSEIFNEDWFNGFGMLVGILLLSAFFIYSMYLLGVLTLGMFG